MPGRHAATSPAYGRRRAPTRPTRARRRVPALALAGAAVVLLAAVLVGWGGSLGGASCDGAEQRLTVAAAPEVAPVVESVAAELDPAELGIERVCGVTVAPTEPDDALAALSAGAFAPDLWIPDTSAWLSQLPPRLAGRQTWSLAKTPLVLAGPSGAPRPETWLSGLSADGAVLLDPGESGASVGALTALKAEAVHGVTSGSAMSTWLVAEARSAPEFGVSDTELLTGDAGLGAQAPRWFPTTEQRFLAKTRGTGTRGLEATVPQSGTVLLDYPLVSVATGPRARDADAVAEALGERLMSPPGARRFADAGFRPASGRPTAATTGLGRVTEIGVVQPQQAADLLTMWATLNSDTRMLAVLDVSGSMNAREGSRTRVGLARDAVLAALRTMPDTWDVGLWAFSLGLGEGTSDHRVLAPVRTLGAVSRGSAHREALTDAVRRLPALVGGGTGLYDTTLAAYREVASGYLSDRLNTVVLLTDGRNEDPRGRSLRQLLDALRQERERGRRMPVVTIGMGPEADTRALRRIAAVTGGVSYVARDPRDIKQILAAAVLERVGWGMQ